jgi:hypothetical protein
MQHYTKLSVLRLKCHKVIMVERFNMKQSGGITSLTTRILHTCEKLHAE